MTPAAVLVASSGCSSGGGAKSDAAGGGCSAGLTPGASMTWLYNGANGTEALTFNYQRVW